MKLLTKIRRFPRALSVSHEVRKRRDAEHIQWAASLVTPKYMKTYMDPDTGEFYEMPCERRP